MYVWYHASVYCHVVLNKLVSVSVSNLRNPFGNRTPVDFMYTYMSSHVTSAMVRILWSGCVYAPQYMHFKACPATRENSFVLSFCSSCIIMWWNIHMCYLRISCSVASLLLEQLYYCTKAGEVTLMIRTQIGPFQTSRKHWLCTWSIWHFTGLRW